MDADTFISFLCLIALGSALAETNMLHVVRDGPIRHFQRFKFTEPLTTAFFTNVTMVAVPSHTICAIRAKSISAKAFDFKEPEGTCILYDPGKGDTPAGQLLVYPNIAFPVDDSLEDVAKRKYAFGIGTYPGQGAWAAVDGNIGSAYLAVTASWPWWQVDLGEQRLIYQVLVQFNPGYGFAYRTVEIRVGKTSGIIPTFSPMCMYPKSQDLADEDHLLCSRYDGIVGRYVSIQMTIRVNLEIREVSVFALKK